MAPAASLAATPSLAVAASSAVAARRALSPAHIHACNSPSVAACQAFGNSNFGGDAFGGGNMSQGGGFAVDNNGPDAKVRERIPPALGSPDSFGLPQRSPTTGFTRAGEAAEQAVARAVHDQAAEERACLRRRQRLLRRRQGPPPGHDCRADHACRRAEHQPAVHDRRRHRLDQRQDVDRRRDGRGRHREARAVEVRARQKPAATPGPSPPPATVPHRLAAATLAGRVPSCGSSVRCGRSTR